MNHNTIPAARQLILASTSPYRAELLGRLGLAFDQVAPDCDETPLPGETPAELVARLAIAKAASVASQYPQAIIIGSDQVADLNGTILGKPHTPDKALQQLQQMSARTVVFRTGYSVLDATSNQQFSGTALTEVDFRELGKEEIERYIKADQPLDCAGAFRSEALGISLLQNMQADDPTSLIGLPLIRVAKALREFGLTVP